MVKCNGCLRFSPGWTLVLFFFITFILFIDRGAVSGVLSTIQDEYSLTAFEAGLLGSAFMMGFVLVSPLSAHLVQSYHPMNIMMISLLFWLVSIFGCSISVNYGMLLSFRAVSGAGEAAMLTLAPPIIIQIAPKNRKTLWLGVLLITYGIGAASGQIYSSIIIYTLGTWRFVFGCEGLLMVPLFILLSVAYRAPEVVINRGGSEHIPFTRQFAELLNIPAFLALCFSTGGISFFVGGFIFWSPSIIHEVYGLSKVESSVAMGSVGAISGLLGGAIGSCLFDLYFKKKVPAELTEKELNSFKAKEAFKVVFYVNLFACSFGVLAIAFENVILFFIGIGLMVFLVMSIIGTSSTAYLSCVRAELREQATAVQAIAGHIIGDLPAPFFIGLVIDLHGYRVGEVVAILWVTTTVLTTGLSFYFSVSCN